MRMEWNRDTCLTLIDHYKARPMLWNTRNGNYYSKEKKQDAWEDIAFSMGSTVDEVKQKMNSLLSSFRREKSKMKRGVGRFGYGCTSRWFAFDRMMFLLDRKEEQSTSDKIFLEELQTKIEEEAMEDLNLDSNPLFDEELNEASTSNSKETEKLTCAPPPKRLKTSHIDVPLLDEPDFVCSQDESTLYGQYVTSKMRNLDYKAKAFAEHAINKVLFEADLGKYDGLAAPFDTNH